MGCEGGPWLVSGLAPRGMTCPPPWPHSDPCPSPSPGVLLKYVLSPITVMDVPVHNQDPGERQLLSYPGHLPPGRGQGLDPWSVSVGVFIVGGRILDPEGKC